MTGLKKFLVLPFPTQCVVHDEDAKFLMQAKWVVHAFIFPNFYWIFAVIIMIEFRLGIHSFSDG